MAQNFIAVINENGSYLASDLFTSGPSIEFAEVRNDKQVEFSVQPVTQNPSDSPNPFTADFLDTDTFAMAIGNIDEAPTSGSVSLQVDATTSGLANLAYNIPTATLQSALNAALATEVLPACVVTLLEAGNYQITGAVNGAIPTGTFSVVNDLLLYPQSSAFFVEGPLGSASSKYQVVLVMRQAPLCYATPTTLLPDADVQIATVQAGDATHNKIQRISFTVPQVVSGGYTVNANAGGTDATCGIATPLMTAQEFGIMLAQHAEINYQTPGELDNIAVTQVGQSWTVEFIGDLKNDDANELSVTNNVDGPLVGPKGKSGTINYNTYGLYIYSLSQSDDSFVLKRFIQRTRVSGEVRTIYQGEVRVYKDMIDAATSVPTPLVNYYTAAQVDALLASNVTVANARFIRYDASQSLSGGEQTQALTNAGGTAPTGTGAVVRANTPTLVTPVLGAATATSIVASGSLSAGGDLIATVAGKGLQLKSGSNARAGNATLVAGTVTVANTTVTANTLILLTRKTAAGTLGAGGYAYSVSAATSFTINSVDLAGVLSIFDTSTLTFLLVELN